MIFDIESLKESILGFLEKSKYQNKNIYKMSNSAYDNFSLDASTLAYDIYWILGVKQNQKEIEEAKKFIYSRQRETDGFFYEVDIEKKLENHSHDRAIEMSSNYLTFQAIGALKVLDSTPKYRISFYDKFIEKKGIINYLEENCPWERSPWGAGGMIDNLGTILDINIKMGFNEYQEVLNDVFTWLNSYQCPKTGLWGDKEVQGINGLINGAYHLMRGTYFLQGKDFSNARLIIDRILENLEENPVFNNYAEGCHDLDHFFLLEKCVKVEKDYRCDEIRKIAFNRLESIKKLVLRSDGAFSFEAKGCLDNHAWIDVSPSKKESDMLGTVFYLQTIISISKILDIKIDLNESKTHG